MENFYNLNPSKEDILGFIETLDENNIHDLMDFEEGYGVPLVTMILNDYGASFLYEIYYKCKKEIRDKLFDKNNARGTKGFSPNDHLILTNYKDAFEIIDKIYDRQYSLIYEIEIYTEDRSLLYYFINNDVFDEFIDLLKKWKVTKSEIKYDELLKELAVDDHSNDEYMKKLKALFESN